MWLQQAKYTVGISPQTSCTHFAAANLVNCGKKTSNLLHTCGCSKPGTLREGRFNAVSGLGLAGAQIMQQLKLARYHRLHMCGLVDSHPIAPLE